MSGATGCKNDKAENRDTNLQCKQEKEDSQGPKKRQCVFKNMTDLEKTVEIIISRAEKAQPNAKRMVKHEKEEAKRRDEEDEQAMHSIKEDNNRRIEEHLRRYWTVAETEK